MDAEDYSLPQATGKIRVRGGRNRAKPYLRKDAKKSSTEKPKESAEQGFLSKVSSYIVPKWISNWFTAKEKEEPKEESSSEDEAERNDEPLPKKTTAESSNQLTGNHVSLDRPLKNLTSTPLVRNPAPFSIIRSEVSDPLEGSSASQHKNQPTILDGRSLLSTENHRKDSVFDRDQPTILDGRSLLSTDNYQRDSVFDRPASREEQGNASASMKYQFHLGTNPGRTPQRFAASRKPSFKVSSFLSSSPMVPSGSSSAFYPGRTSFGGASSFQSKPIKRQRMSPVATNVQTKKACIKPKSLSNSRMGAVTSDTARKILGALERMSSPVHDASKLPSSPSSVLFNPMKRRTEFSFNQSSNRSSPALNQPPTRPLIAPNMFKIQQSSKQDQSSLFTNKFASGDLRPGVSVGTFKSRGLPTSLSPENDYKAGGKMKRQRQSSHFPSAAPEVEEEPVNKLPTIKQAVPLPVKSLPKFDFGSAVTSPVEKDSSAKSEGSKNSDLQTKATKQPSSLFKFSQPEKIAGSLGQKATEPVKGKFQFSAPFVKSKDAEQKEALAPSLTKKTNSKTPVQDENESQISKADSGSIKSGVLSQKETVGSDKTPIKSFANIWGQPKDLWECETCMVNNKPEKNTCAACETPRPGKTESTESRQQTTNIESTQAKSQTNSLAAMFKPAPGMWECPTCMVNNKPDVTVCVACTEKKPGSEATKAASITAASDVKKSTTNVFAKFAPKSGSWECDTCMVQNNSAATACVACTTPKPGAVASASSLQSGKTEASAKISFGLGTSSSSTSNSGSITFGGSGVTFGSGSASATTFGTDTQKGFSFGRKDGTAVSFGSTKGKEVTFGTAEGKGVTFGSTEGKSVSFGSTEGKGFTFGSNEGKKIVTFGSTDPSRASSGSSDGKTVTFGRKDVPGISFGITSKIEPAKDNMSKGFSFGTNSKKVDTTPVFGIGQSKSAGNTDSKTEENNNKIDSKEMDTNNQTIAVPDKKSDLNAFGAKQDIVKATDKPSSFPTIADAAQAGLLKIPETVPKAAVSQEAPKEQNTEAPKFSFGAISNGPVSNPFGTQKAAVSTEQSNVQFGFSSSTEKPAVPSFNFGSGSITKVDSVPAKGFNFTANTNAESKPSVGFSFGTTKETAKTTDDADKTTATAPVFAFGNSSTSKSSNIFGNIDNNKDTIDNKKPFSFAADSTKPFGSSALQQNPQENLFKFTNQQEPAKPTENPTPLFTNNVQNQSGNNTFNSPSLFKNPEPAANPFAMANSTAPTGGFSFGTSSNQSAGGLFANPAAPSPITNNLSGAGGFSFGSPAPVPDTKLFTEKVAQTLSEPAKPFSFTAPAVPNENTPAATGGFQFGAKPLVASSGGFGATQQGQSSVPSAGFSFTNSTPSGGGFSFTGNTNSSTPMFSSGATPAPSNRPIKKAVRRRR